MPDNAEKKEISPGIGGLYVKTDIFKSRRITVSFILPVNAEAAASAALLSKLLISCSKKHPDYSSLSRALNMLYGAKLSGRVIKTGDCQMLCFSVETVNDAYALDGERVTESAAVMLLDMLFEPKTENGCFSADDFDREKRLLIEQINSKINEKRYYAVSTCIEKMCANEPFGVPDAGGLEAAEALDNERLYSYWENVLKSARVNVSVTGSEAPDDVFSLVKERFSAQGIQRGEINKMSPSPFSDSVSEFEEIMAVNQGKLVLGFKTGVSSAEQSTAPMQVFCDIFGGAPYSLLFTVVREKQSLCYYCAARFYSLKGILCVDSGVDASNRVSAREGILSQLECMKNGEFADELIESSKMGISDSLRSIYDSAAGIEMWYLSRTFDKTVMSPEEYIKAVNDVKKDDIVEAAKSVRLDTVFFLGPREGEKNE